MPHCLEVSGDSSFPASQVERPSTLMRHQRQEQLTMELRVAVVAGGARPGHELGCIGVPRRLGDRSLRDESGSMGGRAASWSRTVTPEVDTFRGSDYVPTVRGFWGCVGVTCRASASSARAGSPMPSAVRHLLGRRHGHHAHSLPVEHRSPEAHLVPRTKPRLREVGRRSR
jgi:hypothetical protein